MKKKKPAATWQLKPKKERKKERKNEFNRANSLLQLNRSCQMPIPFLKTE